MSSIRMIVGVIALLVGAVWIGQGLGLIGGSAMSGSAFWAVVGVFLVALAAWLLWTGSRRAASGGAGRESHHP